VLVFIEVGMTEQVLSDDAIDTVSKAMRQAWQLGQTYWRQADSESWTQQAKSDETQKKFEALVDETRAVLASIVPTVDAAEFAKLQTYLTEYHRDTRPEFPKGLAAWALEALTQSSAAKDARGEAFNLSQEFVDGATSKASPETDVQGFSPFPDYVEKFTCYLIDNCERETVTEENLHRWLIEWSKSPRYNPSPAKDAPAVPAQSKKLCDRIVCLRAGQCVKDDAATWLRCPVAPQPAQTEPAATDAMTFNPLARMASGPELHERLNAARTSGTAQSIPKLKPPKFHQDEDGEMVRGAGPDAPTQTADVRAMEKDAERYRWLRRRAFQVDSSDEAVTTIAMFKDEGPTGEFLDDQIDAALQSSQETK
jgi:hypothetical protein